MSTWNYRVVRQGSPNFFCFSVFEVYYNHNNEIEAWSEEPVTPGGVTADELLSDLNLMREAYSKPVLRIIETPERELKMVEA